MSEGATISYSVCVPTLHVVFFLNLASVESFKVDVHNVLVVT